MNIIRLSELSLHAELYNEHNTHTHIKNNELIRYLNLRIFCKQLNMSHFS